LITEAGTPLAYDPVDPGVLLTGERLVPGAEYSGATFGRRCAVPKAKFKGVELVRSLDEGRRLLRALHIYVFENE